MVAGTAPDDPTTLPAPCPADPVQPCRHPGPTDNPAGTPAQPTRATLPAPGDHRASFDGRGEPNFVAQKAGESCPGHLATPATRRADRGLPCASAAVQRELNRTQARRGGATP